MRSRLLLLAALALPCLSAPAIAEASGYVPGEVIVKYRDGTSGTLESTVEQATGTRTEDAIPGGAEQLQIEDGDSVRQTVSELRKDSNVAYAVPNYVARAS